MIIMIITIMTLMIVILLIIIPTIITIRVCGKIIRTRRIIVEINVLK